MTLFVCLDSPDVVAGDSGTWVGIDEIVSVAPPAAYAVDKGYRSVVTLRGGAVFQSAIPPRDVMRRIDEAMQERAHYLARNS